MLLPEILAAREIEPAQFVESVPCAVDAQRAMRFEIVPLLACIDPWLTNVPLPLPIKIVPAASSAMILPWLMIVPPAKSLNSPPVFAVNRDVRADGQRAARAREVGSVVNRVSVADIGSRRRSHRSREAPGGDVGCSESQGRRSYCRRPS